MKLFIILGIITGLLSMGLIVLSYSYHKPNGETDKVFGTIVTICTILLNIVLWLP